MAENAGQGKPEDAPLTREEMALIRRLLSDPTIFPSVFKNWLTAYLEAWPPLLPISQIFGFSGFTAQGHQVEGNDTITSATYVDAGAAGPLIQQLPNGRYAVIFGAQMLNGGFMGIEVNGAAIPTGREVASPELTGYASFASAFLADLNNNNNNTLRAKYKKGGSPSLFVQYRTMLALKTSNL